MVANYTCKPDDLSHIIKYCCFELYPKKISFAFVIRIKIDLIEFVSSCSKFDSHQIISTNPDWKVVSSASSTHDI